MKKRFSRLAAVLLAMTFFFAPVRAADSNSAGETRIRVGLASSSSHTSTKELGAAHLQNNTGYGSGFRFGYYDKDLNFVELARSSEKTTLIAVLKTQNMTYGYDSSAGKYTYSDSFTGDVVVGCYHIRLPGTYDTYEQAAQAAEEQGGFVAYINGEYQVRVGAWAERSDAETALEDIPDGTLVGTSAYGMNVVAVGSADILFQYDMGEGSALGVLPDVTGASEVRTWFSGFKYRGGFSYQRIDGGNMTVVNVVELEDYVKGVVCYEMGREWPLEALKAQAICARTYALCRLNYHGGLGFDVCSTDYCQVYRGVGSNRENYGPSDTSDRAVEETANQVLWYQSALADTYFSSSHGGASESAKLVWGTDLEKYPYLCGVSDPYESTVADSNPYSSWTVTYTADQLTARLQNYGYGTNTSIDHLELTYSDLGNVVRVKLCYANGQSNTITPRTSPGIRSAFGVSSIRFTVNGQTAESSSTVEEASSQEFTVNGSGTLSSLDGVYMISGSGTVEKAGSSLYAISGSGTTSALEASTGTSGSTSGTTTTTNSGTVSVSGSKYVFTGSGNGHQVGMSQYGANAMAKLGFSYDQIVEFYFPGIEVGLYKK